jgi:hypothetical protein
VEVSVAHRGQSYDGEVESLDDCPVLKTPIDDRPRENKAPATRGNAFVSGSCQTPATARASPRNARGGKQAADVSLPVSRHIRDILFLAPEPL